MLKKIQKKLNNRKGFTLIELIVVIVILGILAAILVPTFSVYINRADQAADDATIANIKTALVVAYIDSVIPAAGGSQDITVAAGVVTYVAGGTAGVKDTIEDLYPNLTFKHYTSIDFDVSGAGVVTHTAS